MEKGNEKVVSVIKELLEFVNDGVKGYQTAAEEAKDVELRQFCLAGVRQREEFAGELNTILTEAGVNPEESGTIKGALYRQWMDIKAALTNSDDDAIISSCLYGEEWALKAYDDAIACAEELPQNVIELITGQREKVHKCYTELKEMEALHHH